jgi:hypothetical protein
MNNCYWYIIKKISIIASHIKMMLFQLEQTMSFQLLNSIYYVLEEWDEGIGSFAFGG